MEITRHSGGTALRLSVCTLLCLFASGVFAGEKPYKAPDDIGSGFFLVQGGVWRHFGSARDRLLDPRLIYLQIGWSVSKELGYEDDYAPLKAGFKFGLGFEGDRGGGYDRALGDFMLKLRYTFVDLSSRWRPWVEAGPGYLRFRGDAFQLEAGSGVDFHFPAAFLGVSVQYKETFGSELFDRGLLFLGSLGYTWN